MRNNHAPEEKAMKELLEVFATLSELPESPHELRISQSMADYLTANSGKYPPPEFPAYFGIRVIVARYYKPHWWSEHYLKKVIFHGDTDFTMEPYDPFLAGRITFNPKVKP